MKKLFVLSLVVIVLTIPSFAQDKPNISVEKNVLKVNVLPLLIGTGSIFYERKLTDLISAELGVGFMNYKIEDSKFSGLILTPECRIYPKKNAIDGFYLTPYLRYYKFTVENKVESTKGDLTSMGGGFVFGRQWITDSGFTMDLFFGGHYSSATVNLETGTGSIDPASFDGLRTRFGFALGFAF